MRSYRLYLLDSLGGFVDVDCRQAASDADAIEAAHDLLGQWRPAVEVWEGARFVTQVSREPARLGSALESWFDTTVQALSGPDACPTA